MRLGTRRAHPARFPRGWIVLRFTPVASLMPCGCPYNARRYLTQGKSVPDPVTIGLDVCTPETIDTCKKQ